MVYEICDGICHFAFVVFGQHVWVMHLDLDTMVASFVTKKNIIVQSLVKNECTHIAILLMCNCFWLIPCVQEFNEIPTCVFWYGGSFMN
jgi:hypothetical protein